MSRQTGNVSGRRLEFFSDVRIIPFFHSRVRLAYIPIFEEFAKNINRLYENAFRLIIYFQFGNGNSMQDTEIFRGLSY